MADVSWATSDGTAILKTLETLCKSQSFAPGEVLREKGEHYTTMFLVTDGAVDVDLGIGAKPITPAIEGLGLPIGEIGFLHGYPATATVTAKAQTCTLILDDATLSKIEQERPDLAVELLRVLAETAQERTSHNISLATRLDAAPAEPGIQIRLCRTPSMLDEAQRLRYEVYCEELGRQSPHADHDKKIISDELDDFGHTFIAVEDEKTIGTLRANRPADGPIGILEDLYGMRSSEFHPEKTVVCTKFIIAQDKRTSAAGIKLVASFTRFALQHELRECYIDCIPSLRPFYMALGFRRAGAKFLHRENGPSLPMKVDMVKYKGRIERVLLSKT